ncbi:MAG: hypothetical protein J6A96_05245, partial [Clostridia bacterium]|nr:hypothetical protein [Clostridia bacterium]
LYIDGGATLTVANTTFNLNKAKSNTHGGGVLYLSGSKGEMTEVTLTSNESHRGGAIAIHSSSTLTVNSMNASGNKATATDSSTLGVGGVFNVTSSTLKLEEKNGSIVLNGNSAVSGGAIYAESATITIDGASLEGNTATSAGGAICASAGTLTINNSMFDGNAGVNGGAINASTTVVTIKGSSTMQNNTASYGGAIYATKAATTIDIEDTTFTQNSATQDGGAIYSTVAPVTVKGTATVFSKNSANRGGAAYLVDAATFTMSDGNFDANTATNGGAIHGRANCTATFTNTSFDSNSATGTGDGEGGGAIYLAGTTLNATGVTFTDNTATNGAAIGMSNSTATAFNLTSCVFIRNEATNNGGAVYIQNGKADRAAYLVIDGCTFEDNSATAAGSSVYVRTNSSVTIANITSYGGTYNTGWASAIYATTGSNVIFRGTVVLQKDGAGTADTIMAKATATVEYTSTEEKDAWQSVIGGGGTISYVDISTESNEV